ncbi:MAG: histidine phosphatase family protein [Alphaproteobacteria bacterium]|jgi:probable phosphoglycerate mutase|nr:histidine phosphatase family protein [Alphaproteobacteria bacterium]
MTLLAVIRHGPTEWNAARKLQGMSDIPLSAEGRALVATWKLPEEFRPWRFLSSPLERAQETAKLLGAQTLMVEPLLREMSFGEWEGFTVKELAARGHPDEFQALADKGLDMLPPGGESPRMVIERLQTLLKRLAQEGHPTVAVCHKGVIRALLSLATGWPMLGRQPVKLDWSSLHCFRLDKDGTPTLDRINVSLREIADIAP